MISLPPTEPNECRQKNAVVAGLRKTAILGTLAGSHAKEVSCIQPRIPMRTTPEAIKIAPIRRVCRWPSPSQKVPNIAEKTMLNSRAATT